MSGFYISLLLIIAAVIVVGAAFWLRQRRRRLFAKSKEDLGAVGAWFKDHPTLQPQYVEFDGEKIYYIQIGKGPDLVLLHGIGASLFIWRFIIKRLAENYRVTAFDIPGFGRSSKNIKNDYGLDAQRKRINKFLDILKIRRCYLVGSSMGGAISLWMAHENPERYPKVAALAPATSPEIIPKGFPQLVAMLPYTHKTLNRNTMRIILNLVVAKPELINTETIEAYLEPFLDQGISMRTFLAALQLLGDRRMPKCFAGLRSRVLIIQGQRDRLVTMKSIQRLAKIIPDAEVITSATGGHHIMEDEPDWTTAEILRFFAR